MFNKKTTWNCDKARVLSLRHRMYLILLMLLILNTAYNS